jgi:hypothetical protein
MTTLEAAAWVSAAWALAGLAISVARAWRRGTAPVVAAPAGSAWRGVAYAFGPGMSPRAKESASQHPFVFAAGVVYHLGILAALTTLALTLARVEVSGLAGRALLAMLLVAFGAGIALLARRLRSRLLRSISAPDDYAANLLVDAWLATAALAWITPGATSAFLVTAILLGLYTPLGKIRHCVFFFLARGRFGARLGTRGLVGSRAREAWS